MSTTQTCLGSKHYGAYRALTPGSARGTLEASSTKRPEFESRGDAPRRRKRKSPTITRRRRPRRAYLQGLRGEPARPNRTRSTSPGRHSAISSQLFARAVCTRAVFLSRQLGGTLEIESCRYRAKSTGTLWCTLAKSASTSTIHG